MAITLDDDEAAVAMRLAALQARAAAEPPPAKRAKKAAPSSKGPIPPWLAAAAGLSAALPFATPGLPGVGGCIKAVPEHFCVTERASFTPDGAGDHIYITLRRTGMNTRAVAAALAAMLGCGEASVGFAGRKDRHAVVEQTFSVPAFDATTRTRDADGNRVGGEWLTPASLAARVAAGAIPGVGVAASPAPARNRKKLRRGQLAGNAFAIVVTQLACPQGEALARCGAIAAKLRTVGWPNYYGPQRFGNGGSGGARGLALLTGLAAARGAQRRRLKRALYSPIARLHLSAVQSALFNACVAARLRAGAFGRVLGGDLLQGPHGGFARPARCAGDCKGAIGGSSAEGGSDSCDCDTFRRGFLTYSGPMFGYRMKGRDAARRTGTAAGRLEAGVLAESGLVDEVFKHAKLDGTRRPARLLLREDTAFSVEAHEATGGLEFRFALPRGCYATTFLREFLKATPARPESDQVLGVRTRDVDAVLRDE